MTIDAVTAVAPTKLLNWRKTISSSERLAKPPINTAASKISFKRRVIAFPSFLTGFRFIISGKIK